MLHVWCVWEEERRSRKRDIVSQTGLEHRGERKQEVIDMGIDVSSL